MFQGKNKQRILIQIIKEIAQEANIHCTTFSHNWIIKLTKATTTKYIFGYNFELNTATAKDIAGDKSATYEILTNAQVPAIEHSLLMSPQLQSYVSKNGNWANIIELTQQYQYPIILKPNTGTGGNSVFKANNTIQLEKAVHELFEKNRAICISPFHHIQAEYRIIVLDKQVEFGYKKIAPHLIGDGKTTFFDLITQQIKKGKLPPSILTEIDEYKADFDTIPKDKEVKTISWKFNLGKGATAQLLKEESIKTVLFPLAIQAAQAINIRFASIDIAELSDGTLKVLEINSGIMTEKFATFSQKNYNLVKKMYKKAIHLMLDM